MEEKNNGNTIKWLMIVIASVTLTIAIIKTVDAANLNERVTKVEEEVNKIDVVLEKIENIEENISKIEINMREDRNND